MHGRLDTSLPELNEWIVLASAEGKSPSLACEKERAAHSPGRPLDYGQEQQSCRGGAGALTPEPHFF